MRILILCGISESEAGLVTEALSSPQLRSLDYRIARGFEAAQSASVMIVNGDDPASVRKWTAVRQDFPHPLGVVFTSHGAKGCYFAEQIVPRPVSALSIASSLENLERALASRAPAVPGE